MQAFLLSDIQNSDTVADAQLTDSNNLLAINHLMYLYKLAEVSDSILITYKH